MSGPYPRDVLVNLQCGKARKIGPAFADTNPKSARHYITITDPAACGTMAAVPVAATCQEVLYENPRAPDGEYPLHCPEARVTFSVWCHNMASGSPKEYLSLSFENNNAQYLCGPRCMSRHPTSSTVTTSYTKVRINPCNLTVDVTDRTFSTSTGSITHGSQVITSMPFGTAGSCEDSGTQNHPGRASVNFQGSPLAISSTWLHQGASSYGSVVFTPGHQSASIEGGGFCGENAPVGFRIYDPPSTSQWVLQLRAEGPPPPPSPPLPPPPTSKVVWGISQVGATCVDYCRSVSRVCVENQWPRTLAAFQGIITKLPTADCSSITAGNYPSNPQRSTPSGPGLCTCLASFSCSDTKLILV